MASNKLHNEPFFELFRKAVSNERLDMYSQRGAAPVDTNLVTHYAWNIALSESLYPTLQCVEITLRNSIHNAATIAFETEYWYDIPNLLNEKSLQNIKKTKFDLQRKNKIETSAQIVATLNFGFWTGLFYSDYDQKFFTKIAKTAFPYLNKSERTRRRISKPLNEIRKLRNRIMHHEPIWHLKDLSRHHQNIKNIISWTNPAMLEFVEAIDRFPLLYQNGMNHFKEKLAKNFYRI